MKISDFKNFVDKEVLKLIDTKREKIVPKMGVILQGFADTDFKPLEQVVKNFEECLLWSLEYRLKPLIIQIESKLKIIGGDFT